MGHGQQFPGRANGEGRLERSLGPQWTLTHLMQHRCGGLRLKILIMYIVVATSCACYAFSISRRERVCTPFVQAHSARAHVFAAEQGGEQSRPASRSGGAEISVVQIFYALPFKKLGGATDARAQREPEAVFGRALKKKLSSSSSSHRLD